MKFAILEVGSTITKSCIWDNGLLEEKEKKAILFKKNYNSEGKILETDIQTLIDFIKEIKKETDKVYAYGTSIFRKITDEERTSFIKRIKDECDVDFKVVSSDEENSYTVKGVIDGIDYKEKFAVIIGGGGSTEVSIIENLKITKQYSLDFGAIDITEAFPNLKDDKADVNFEEITNYIMDKITDVTDNVDTMVIAGGDFIYFYETIGYKMDKNTLYEDKNAPFMHTFEDMDYYDHDMLNISLDDIKLREPDNAAWWNGARGMRFCINTLARKMKASNIIPTRINMLLGLSKEIVKENDK